MRVCVCVTYHKGGIPTLRHNEIRDLTAELLKEQASNVSTEPRLQPLHDERFQFRSANGEDEARLDARASDFWCKGQEAFFDIRVFYPIAPLIARRILLLCTVCMNKRRRDNMLKG